MKARNRSALIALSAILCLSLSGCIGSLLYALAGGETSSSVEETQPEEASSAPISEPETEPAAEAKTEPTTENPEDLLDYGDIQDVKDGPLELWMENSYEEGAPVYVKVNGVSPDMVSAGAGVALFHTGDSFDNPIEVLPLAEGENVYRFEAQTPGYYDVRLYEERQPFSHESLLFTLYFTVTGSFDDGDGNRWAALYADYLRGVDFTTEELYLVDGYATMPSCVMNEIYTAVSGVSFYEVDGYDYPLMALTEFVEMEEGSGRLDGTPGTLVYLIKDGAVTYDKTEAERAAILTESPAGGSFVNGEWIMDFGLTGPEGEQGPEAVEANFAALYSWLDGQSTAPASGTATGAPAGLNGFWYTEYPDPNGQGRVLTEAAFNSGGDFFFAAGWVESEYAIHVVGTYTVSGNEIRAAGADTFSEEEFSETFTFEISGDTLRLGYKGAEQYSLDRTEAEGYALPISLG